MIQTVRFFVKGFGGCFEVRKGSMSSGSYLKGILFLGSVACSE